MQPSTMGASPIEVFKTVDVEDIITRKVLKTHVFLIVML